MTISENHQQVSTDDAVTARLESWSSTDESIGEVREVEMLRAMKERGDLRLIEQDAELHAHRIRVAELEAEVAELRIRLQKTRESAASLRAELHVLTARSLTARVVAKLRSLLRRR